ncbi:MAG: phosphoglycerate kinase [Parcubacteria group bacterium LiPW_15]|nr:MAG: phosphoglycerate kinase [Parcubacteria group bacterium LiPW_15]
MMKLIEKTPKEKLEGVGLLRLDFNSEDNWRMKAALPTLRYLSGPARVLVILSHKGRPIGFSKNLSLKKVAENLGKLLHRKITFIPHFNFELIKHEISRAADGSIFMLENLRFIPGEETNSAELGKKLASLGDYYVNEAFAVSHRAHASVSAITRYLPSYAGLGMAREALVLCEVMNAPKKPLVVILGGGKAGDKLGVLKFLRNRADKFLLGGAPANTLSMLEGVKVGKSLVEGDKKRLKALKAILAYRNLILPIDFRRSGNSIFDIGPHTEEIFAGEIKKAKTLIWNGPVGYFEEAAFAKGSLAIARAVKKNNKLFSIVGGGETVAFLKKYKMTGAFSFISTGGGAMLDFLAGKKLPGIVALEKNGKTNRTQKK